MLIKINITYEEHSKHIHHRELSMTCADEFSETKYINDIFITETIINIENKCIYVIICNTKDNRTGFIYNGVTHIFGNRIEAFKYLYNICGENCDNYILKEMYYDDSLDKFIMNEIFYKKTHIYEPSKIEIRTLYNYDDKLIHWPIEIQSSIFDTNPNLIHDLEAKYGSNKLSEIRDFFDKLNQSESTY